MTCFFAKRGLLQFLAWAAAAGASAWADCGLGWQGTVLADGDSLTGWAAQADPGASASLGTAAGLTGGAVELHWDLGAGGWAQAVYNFPSPADLGAADIFGVSLRGGGPAETPNRITLTFVDAAGGAAAYDLSVGENNGSLNQVDRWMSNLPALKKNFVPAGPMDWSRVIQFIVIVKRPGIPGAPGGGAGLLRIDHLQSGRAADWPRPSSFLPVAPEPAAAQRALDYIMSQQDPATGLIVSWREEESLSPPAKSWLYDQALALIALSSAGDWSPAGRNGPAQAADRLAAFLKVSQKTDGHWARVWNTRTGAELGDDRWIGDQGWLVMSLSVYARKAGDSAATEAARRGAAWLAPQVGPTGQIMGHVEGEVDAWWALMSAFRFAEADRLRDYLLTPGLLWDPDVGYWGTGLTQPRIAMDAATWLSAFARHPRVGQAARGLSALGFVRRTLYTSTDDGNICGFDGLGGPIGVWNEGTAQFVAAGGEDALSFRDALLGQQRPDGSMPNSQDRWQNALVWLTPWSGLAPTSWLYFALTGAPFEHVPRPYEASHARDDAPLAFDGDDATAWAAPAGAESWLEAYWGLERTVDRASVRWGSSRPAAWRIELSNDGARWTTAAVSSGGADAAVFPPVRARHGRLRVAAGDAPGAWSVGELAFGYGAGASASSVEGPSLGPEKAFDGDPDTRWSSSFSDPQWLALDLGSVRPVGRAVIDWEAAHARSYLLETSPDGASWTEAARVTGGDGGRDVLAFGPFPARFVRLHGLERATPYGYSVWEMSVSSGPFAEASSEESPALKAAHAFDGDPDTRWSSDFSDAQWIALDLGERSSIAGLELSWEAAFAVDYAVWTSPDGRNWTEVASVRGSDGGQDVVSFASVEARHVRIDCERRGTPWGYSLWEVKPVAAPPSPLSTPGNATTGEAYVFPNPVRRGEAAVFHVETDAGEAEVRVYDADGTLVHRLELRGLPEGSPPAHEGRWDTAGASPGVYFYTVEAGGSRRRGVLSIRQ